MPHDSRQDWDRTVGEPVSAFDTLADIQNSVAYPAQARIVEALTLRESEVLRRVALGHSNEEVAAQLSMTRDGVKYHLKNIYTKLGAARRTDAIRIASDCGFLKPTRPDIRHHVVASRRSQFARSRSAA